ncbi:MAG: putative heme iron utilization protein [Bradymonadia bacterium]|jgi:putative heme iron utilization protein
MTDANDAELDVAEHGASAADDARRWLLTTPTATLCTTSVKPAVAGYPFGSVVPFALDRAGRPFILIARIAAHTGNLRKDPRGALFVHDPAAKGDPQASWRITVMGDWAAVAGSDPEWPELSARYAERVPQADSYRKTHSFAFWRMHTVRAVRFIGGFGRIVWLPADALDAPADLGDAATYAVDHLNDDHRHNLSEMCAALAKFDAPDAQAVRLDATGLLVESKAAGRHAWFSFGRAINAGEIRTAVIALVHQARAVVDA